MRIAMTSPSFDVVAKVPSPPRYDQTRARDRNQPIRPKAMRVALKRDQAGAAAIAARLELPRPTAGEAGIHCSIATDLLYLEGKNIAALPLITSGNRSIKLMPAYGGRTVADAPFVAGGQAGDEA
jgi:hypothetical protein